MNRGRLTTMMGGALAIAGTVLAAGWAVFAQQSPYRNAQSRPPTSERRGPMDPSRGMIGDPRKNVPEWTVKKGFERDVFTFARLRYQSATGRAHWRVDWPGADLNFSYRLQQMTSIAVDPEGVVLDIDDPKLFDYPFVFIIDPRNIYLSEEEAKTLRRYMLGGGFIIVDDFWGNRMYNHLMGELKKVFPDREPVSLPLDHQIFNLPFHLSEKPQVPSEDSAHAMKDAPGLLRTWEFEITWEEPQPADYRAILDDKGRMMFLICWNTDLSDGWEEETISPWFFENYAEKYSFPMGINILFYVMSH